MQTLILPHLNKEEERYLPVMLYRFSEQQLQSLHRHLFVLYGKLLDDRHIVTLLCLATPLERRRFVCEFLPNYISFKRRKILRPSGGDADPELFCPKADFLIPKTWNLESVAEMCSRDRPKLWALLRKHFPDLVQSD